MKICMMFETTLVLTIICALNILEIVRGKVKVTYVVRQELLLVARLETLTHEVSRQYSRSSLYLAESHFDNRIELARMLDMMEK